MQLGWIDFSREDRAKAMGVIHLLQERIAVDELGFGIIRDAFADAFFPGTSTIQTRAKYFLLVPYIVKEATSGKYGYDKHVVLKKIDELERAAARRMFAKNKDEPGLIGRLVLPNGWVSRKPSDIYWNGIRRLGIYKGENSFSEFIGGMLEFNSSKGVNLGRTRTEEDGSGDDCDSGLISGIGYLDINGIYSKSWLDDLDMRLTHDEALYLENRILNSEGTRDSLFALVVRERDNLEQFSLLNENGGVTAPFELFARSVRGNHTLSERNEQLLRLAGDFNNFVYAARVYYNLLMENEDAPALWNQIREIGLNVFARINIEETLVALDLKPNYRYCRFMIQFKQALLDGDEDKMRREIVEQEKRLKGIRAKLPHKERYDSQKWIGGKWLDFRLGDTARIVKDVFDGLGVKPC